jgi:hypothetical protein
LNSPPRRYRHVRIERQGGDLVGWYVIFGEHGSLHSGFDAALVDAQEIASGFGVAVQSSAGRSAR